MAETQSPTTANIDPKTGYSPHTKIYHSLHPSAPLPSPSQPLSIYSYTISLLHSPTSAALSTTPFLIDPDTGHHLTYEAFLHQVTSLSSYLNSLHPVTSISKNDVAFVLSPPSLHVPVLYFSLLSLNVVVSPSNPLASPSELAHQIQLSKPVVAFSTSAFAHKLPPNLPVILLDSPKFLSAVNSRVSNSTSAAVSVNQSDTAAILYSSGTTGRVKGVVLTHRNLIAVISGFYDAKISNDEKAKKEEKYAFVSLFTLPLFHVSGFFMLLRAASLGESVVVMKNFDLVKMLEAVERYRVTYIPVAPPIVLLGINNQLLGN